MTQAQAMEIGRNAGTTSTDQLRAAYHALLMAGQLKATAQAALKAIGIEIDRRIRHR
jgi:hypothetical protein